MSEQVQIELSPPDRTTKVREFIVRAINGAELIRGRLVRVHHPDVGELEKIEVDHPVDTIGPRSLYPDNEALVDIHDDEAKKRVILKIVAGGALFLVGAVAAAEIYRHIPKGDDVQRKYGH